MSPAPSCPDEMAFRREPIVRLSDGLAVGEEWLLDHQLPHEASGWLRVYLALAERIPLALTGPGIWTAVNAASEHLSHRHFRPLWIAMARRCQENGRKLVVEWTEHPLSTPEGLLLLECLRRDYDVGIAIDDVGSAGLDSIWRMVSICPDWIKIDGAFFQKAQNDPWVREIAQGIIQSARGRGIPVVAEWIETREQRDFAVRIGAEYGQGFWFRNLKEYPRCTF